MYNVHVPTDDMPLVEVDGLTDGIIGARYWHTATRAEVRGVKSGQAGKTRGLRQNWKQKVQVNEGKSPDRTLPIYKFPVIQTVISKM